MKLGHALWFRGRVTGIDLSMALALMAVTFPARYMYGFPAGRLALRVW